MKVSKLTGAQLDYWVAKAEGLEVKFCSDRSYVIVDRATYNPSTSWGKGGQIIEWNNVSTNAYAGYWMASIRDGKSYEGKTALEAAMRCYVASKFGDEVPDAISH